MPSATATRSPRARLVRPKLEEALHAAWARGTLEYKLRPYQKILYDAQWKAILDPDTTKFCSNTNRRFGKSTVTLIVATEFARRLPGAMIRCGAPTAKALKKIVLPIMRQIVSDAPEEFCPKWIGQDSVWRFPNGSEIHISGVNEGHADDLRGTASNLSIVDECGFIDDPEYLINDVLMPQTLDKGGTLLVSSTPPPSPAHEYVAIAKECKADGRYIHRDIFDMGLPAATVERYAKVAGGRESSTWKREWLALFVKDEELAIIPEWKKDYVQDVEPTGLSKFWHRYVAMDTGVRDFTAVLFAYYDFRLSRLVVEDELIINGPKLTTKLLNDEMRAKEALLEGYRTPEGADRCYRRVADNNNLQLINDMNSAYSLAFMPTSKDTLLAMVNEVRLWVGAGRILVHPRCKNLIGCLDDGVWKSKTYLGREFGRAKQYGHYDALAALVYLVRNIDAFSNPVPAGHGLDPLRQWINPKVLENKTDATNVLKTLFRRRF